MSDIPDLQVALIVFGSASMWFCGFLNGKWHGIQKERQRQFRVETTQRKLDASRKRGIQR
jgi:hypothetical protein